jgi:hypothetical protein
VSAAGRTFLIFFGLKTHADRLWKPIRGYAIAWSAIERPVQEIKFPAGKFFGSKRDTEISEEEAPVFFHSPEC